MIYPANDKVRTAFASHSRQFLTDARLFLQLIAKYSDPETHYMIRETKELYAAVHKPYVERSVRFAWLLPCDSFCTLACLLQSACFEHQLGVQSD